MIKSLLFHIGDPKTGTTSIQAAMQARACDCPTVSLAVQREANASALANSLKQPKGTAEKRRKHFSDKAQWATEETADLGLISAEFFSGVSPEALRGALQDFLPEHTEQTRILAYARAHSDRFVSVYAQSVKAGGFQGDMDAFLPVALNKARWNYAPRFAAWREVFGERFTLRPFVRSELFKNDVVQDFFNQALQGEAFSLRPMPKVNEALTVPELAAMRQIQDVLTDRGIARYFRLSLGGALGRAMPQHAKRLGGKPVLTKPHAEALFARYAKDAAETDRLFFEAPILMRAQEEAVAQAAQVEQSFEAEAYYSARRIAKMRKVAGQIADAFEAVPGAWRADYQYLRGQRFVALKDGPDARQRMKNAKHVWALIHKLSKLMLN